MVYSSSRPSAKHEYMQRDIVLVLPNIRSAHNVGSMFRTADATGVSKIYLSGYTPLPVDKFKRIRGPQKEIAKTALGAEKDIPYEFHENFKQLIAHLKSQSYLVVALEQSTKSDVLDSEKSINVFRKKIKKNLKIALVVGEEVAGLNQRDLNLMDAIIELPMYGKKESLNVSVATGIALYIFRTII